MKQYSKRANRRPVSTATMSALALVLSAAPVVIDLSAGGLAVSSAYAESSCFVAGTLVRMADGSTTPIERIRAGDRVLGLDGHVNRVVGLERVSLGNRKLYALNGGRAFVTAEHPFHATAGWKSISPRMTRTENPALAVSVLTRGDRVHVWAGLGESAQIVGATALAPQPIALCELRELETIEDSTADPHTPLFNLLLDGNHTYFADDYLVHNKGGESGEGGGSGGSDSDSSGSGSSGSDSSDSSGDSDSSSDSGESGESGGSDDSGESSESGESGGSDDSGESGESGESGDSDDSGESGESGDDEHSADDSGEDGERGRGRGRGGRSAEAGERGVSAEMSWRDVEPAGSDLSTEQEESAIRNGWK